MILTPGATTLATLETLWRNQGKAALDPAARPAVDAAAQIVRDAARGGAPVYGVNTGFGKLASVRIAPDDTETLQRNLILSHCCGVGEPLDPATTRLMMALKLLSLGRGASGVRWEICAQIEAMLAAGITPVIPSKGSVGASGDLAPLAHLAAVMIGQSFTGWNGGIDKPRWLIVAGIVAIIVLLIVISKVSASALLRMTRESDDKQTKLNTATA